MVRLRQIVYSTAWQQPTKRPALPAVQDNWSLWKVFLCARTGRTIFYQIRVNDLRWAVCKRTKVANANENFVFREHFVDISPDKNENARWREEMK